MPVSVPPAELTGTIARRPFAPPVMLKLSVFAAQVVPENAEPLRKSSQVSSWRPETTGVPCALAEAMTWSDAVEAA